YAFGGGATQDPADKPGVGNMVADLLDEGSGDLDSNTFHERLDRRAIELSFSAGRDAFRGSLRMLRDNKDEAFDLLRSSLTSPHFETADVERIRSQVISGLRRDTTNPTSLASRKFLEMTFGGPGVMRSDPNFMAAYVVNHILGGGGLSSRLYREVREKRGLAYSVFESLLWMEDSAVFIGNTGTRADRAGDTMDAIEKEVRRIADEGPTQKELDEAKSYLKGSQMLALDTSSKLAQALLQYQQDKLPIDY